MTLSALIRKRENATATVATPATHKGAKAGTVANVASVAVANQLLAEEETAIRAWLAHIEEADPATIADVLAVWHTPGLRKPGWRWGVTLYAILIMAATVFVKQHAAIDVLAGLLTGAIAYVFVYVIVGRRRDRRLGRDC